MSKKQTVEILGKSYVIGSLNYTVIRKLARKWGLEKVADVEQKITQTLMQIAGAEQDDGMSLKFNALDTLGEMILMVLEVNNAEMHIDDVDVMMGFLMNENIETFQKIVEAFAADMQTPEVPKQLQSDKKKAKQPKQKK